MQFARNVETLLNCSNLTPQVFSELIGIHRTTLARIRKAQSRGSRYVPMYSTVKKVSEVCSVNVGDLMDKQITHVFINLDSTN